MRFLEIMGVIGLPSVCAIAGYMISIGRRINILMKAVQAQMRDNLMRQYHKHMKSGFISEDDLKEWENQYQAYHALGQNGIMDKRRNDLLNLPSKI